MLRLLPLCCALSAAAGHAAVSIEPPPGWTDVSAEKATAQVVAALQGPEASSFVLVRVAQMPLDNRAAVLSFLGDVLAALNRRGGAFTQSSGLVTATYENGATFQFIKASRGGNPRLVLGVTEYDGQVMLGTLSSAVPDTLLPSILSGLRGARALTRPASAGPTLTRDGQLAFSLPEGLTARELSESERRMGFVLAIKGADAELMILKVAESDDTAGRGQLQIVRQTVLSVAGVDAASLSAVERFKTPPGTDFIFATAVVRDGFGTSRFMAGYLPWAYWGYSVLAKGSDPAALARQALGGLALGPSASPKLVASTPRIPVSSPAGLLLRRYRFAAGAAAVALGLFGAWLVRSRSKML